MMSSTNPAHVYELVALIVIFFLTSVIGVVTGSNSLITAPTMLAFGIEPRVALATNMFGLMFMSRGGTLPFLGSGAFDRRRLSLLVSLTLVGSVLGVTEEIFPGQQPVTIMTTTMPVPAHGP
jgi:uncharacterized protein